MNRQQMRERIKHVRELVEASTMPERLRRSAEIILRAPTQRQVTVIIALAKRYPPEEDNELE